MSIFDKLFVRSKSASGSGQSLQQLLIDPSNWKGLSLQLLFPSAPVLEPDRLQSVLRAYGGLAANATYKVDAEGAKRRTPFGQAKWGPHIVDFVGIDAPMPPETIEQVVAPAHYAQPLKIQARAHKAHLLFYYRGSDPSGWEQYAALAAVAGATATQGALIVANEAAHTSLPAQVIDPRQIKGDRFAFLRELPPLLLYMGFVKYNMENGHVWMRSYGGEKLGLPNLAKLASGHQEGERTMDMFHTILGYLKDSGKRIADGHTLQISSEVFLKFRVPTQEEYFLHDPAGLLVLEEIAPDQINRAPEASPVS